MIIHAYPAKSNAAQNPFNRILSDALEGAGAKVREPSPLQGLVRRADIVLLNWPQSPLEQNAIVAARRTLVNLVTLCIQRVLGAKVTWIVHNVRSHSSRRPRLERIYMRIVAALLSGVVFLTEQSRALAYDHLPRLAQLPFVVVPHSVYGNAYPPSPDRMQARIALGLPQEGRLVGLVGDLKLYKGADDFLRAFLEKSAAELEGLLAGATSEDELRERMEAAVTTAQSSGRRLHRIDQRLDGSQLVTALAALDLLVLPYRGGENSGIAVLAAERGTPILARESAAIHQLSGLLGPSAVQLYAGKLNGAILAEAVRKARAAAPERIADFQHSHSPSSAARTLCSFFGMLRQRGRFAHKP